MEGMTEATRSGRPGPAVESAETGQEVRCVTAPCQIRTADCTSRVYFAILLWHRMEPWSIRGWPDASVSITIFPQGKRTRGRNATHHAHSKGHGRRGEKVFIYSPRPIHGSPRTPMASEFQSWIRYQSVRCAMRGRLGNHSGLSAEVAFDCRSRSNAKTRTQLDTSIPFVAF
ncbi:unnamed protein product [Calypogeia fissa]